MGNALWTFGGQGQGAPTALRFLAVSLLGLALNQSIVHITVNMLDWPFAIALAVVVMVVPNHHLRSLKTLGFSIPMKRRRSR